MPPRADKYVADTLQKLPHAPASIFCYCSQAQKHGEAKCCGSREWLLGNTLASAACLLSCLIHSLYHLIRGMGRCAGEALSP